MKRSLEVKIKYFVVSDVHGFYSILMNTLAEKGFDIDNPNHHLIICGDAFDRGKEAKQLQDFLVMLLEQNRLIYICGNHEELLIQLVCELPQIADHVEWTHHASNGTLHTLSQLTGMTISQIKRDPWRAQRYFYNTSLFKTVLPEIIDYAEIGDYIFVHGWIPSFAHLDDFRNANPKEWQEARWWNGMEMWHNRACRVPGKTIVCGHWNCSWGHAYADSETYTEFGQSANWEPFEREGIIAIDRCTAYTRQMNCIVLEFDAQ